VAQIWQNHVDETHQSHDCALGIAYLFEYLNDLESFVSALPVVCKDNRSIKQCVVVK
jgi:hypothetical protein